MNSFVKVFTYCNFVSSSFDECDVTESRGERKRLEYLVSAEVSQNRPEFKKAQVK